MRLSRFLLLGGCAAILAACSGGGEASSMGGGPKGGGDASLQETLAEPAPEGETALNVEVLADGLVNPWSIAFLPDHKR